MKFFTKVALVSAIAISGNAMAMQALDDSALSSTTGQDGITVKINSPGITIDKLLVHDNDGIGAAGGFGVAAGANTAGAIIVNGITIAPQTAGETLATINIDTDGGSAADGSGAFLNLGVHLAATNIGVGSIKVGKSNALPTFSATSGARRGVVNTAATEVSVLDGVNLAMGATDLNIQLGSQPQGAMIKLSGVVTGGIELNNLTITDADGLPGAAAAAIGATGSGSIVLDKIKLTNAGAADLSSTLAINVDSGVGLAVTLSNSNYDAYVQGVHLGSASAASIGDIEVQGLHLGGTTLLVSGH